MKFPSDYMLLEQMYNDDYFPNFLVDKVKVEIVKVVKLLQTGETDLATIQTAFDAMCVTINDLQEEFEENDSEIETNARECIAADVEKILDFFNIEIDVEDALAERDW